MTERESMADYERGLREAMHIFNVHPSSNTVVGLMLRLNRQSESIRDLQNEVKKLKASIETTDNVMAEAEISVSCIVCDRYYVLDYEVSNYDPAMSYCGRSERCCP